MQQKYAYLIMAHGNFNILEHLMRLLDYPWNDIYIRIDKKVKNFDFNYFQKICNKATVFFTSKRIDVKWGRDSQVKTELLLYRTAFSEKYRYYHLLSGVDLPLKCNQEITDFFNKEDHEFIYYFDHVTKWDYQRLSRYHFPKTWDVRIVARLNWLQDIFHIDRIKKFSMTFSRGYNWCSLTQAAVKYILLNEKFINRLCKYSVCADECYKQYLLCNSEFRDKIIKDDLREVDWERRVKDSPHIYTSEDLKILQDSNKFFARKFDERVDMDIVNKLVSYIKFQEKLYENRDCNGL